MTDRIQNYYAEIDKKDGETAAKEGLAIKECDKNEMKKKKKEAKEWHKQDPMMKGLKKPKALKRKMILVGEPKDAQPIVESHSSTVEPENVDVEMAGTAAMPEPNVNIVMAEKVSELEPIVEEMVVKTPMSEPKLKGSRLKKMTIKRSMKKKKVKKASKPTKLDKATIEGDDQNKSCFEDSLELTKVIDSVVQDIRNEPGSPPYPLSPVTQLASGEENVVSQGDEDEDMVRDTKS